VDDSDLGPGEVVADAPRTTTIRVPGPVVLQTLAYGEIKLARLTVGNLGALARLARQELSARDYVTAFLVRQVIAPPLAREEMAGWDEDALIGVTDGWLRAVAAGDGDLQEGVPPLEEQATRLRQYVVDQQRRLDESFLQLTRPVLDIAQQFRDQQVSIAASTASAWAGVDSTLRSLSDGLGLSRMHSFLEEHHASFDLAARLQTTVPPSLFTISAGLGEMFDRSASLSSSALFDTANSSLGTISPTGLSAALTGIQGVAASIVDTGAFANRLAELVGQNLPQWDIGSLFGQLPDLSVFARDREELRRASASLEESGFAFTEHLWSWSFYLKFAELSAHAPGAAVTNRMLAIIRTDWVREELEETITGSKVLKRRWKIVGPALAAHLRREYTLAVPALLTQLEGMIGDALILKGGVCARGHKLYVRGPDGALQLHQKGKLAGKPIEVKGLDELVRRTGFLQHEELDRASELITTTMVGDRNAILHGRRTGYGKAKLSAQILLLLYVLAREIAAFEAGEVTW
jgi:hypothetical protein